MGKQIATRDLIAELKACAGSGPDNPVSSPVLCRLLGIDKPHNNWGEAAKVRDAVRRARDEFANGFRAQCVCSNEHGYWLDTSFSTSIAFCNALRARWKKQAIYEHEIRAALQKKYGRKVEQIELFKEN